MREAYDKYGKSMVGGCICVPPSVAYLRFQVDKEGPGMDDAAGFFAKVFGGDRFEEYVRNLCSYTT